MISAIALVGTISVPASAAAPVAASESGLPWPSGVSISSKETRAFEAWRGRPLDVETVFFGTKTWKHMISSASSLRTKLPTVPGRLVVALGMVPADHSGQLAECAAGLFDHHIQALGSSLLVNGGAAAAAVGKPLLLRLGWEANAVDSGFPWYMVGDGAAWRDCFRRWVDILNPVTDASTVPPTRRKNFVIVWNMANRGNFPHPIDNAWPGEDYVDVVGSQFYDRCPPLPEGKDAEWARRLSALDRYGNPAGPLAWLNYARSKGKPYAIPEWGIGGPTDVCARPGIDNPHFIRKMHEFLAANAADIAFEAYFNAHGFADDSKGSHKLFAPDTSHPDPGTPDYATYVERYHPRSAAAYRELWGRDPTPLPAELSIAASSRAAAEGNQGATPFTFTISRAGNPDQAVTVQWRVTGEASSEDFAGGALPAGAARLAAGELTGTVTVMVRGDLDEEADETFQVTLSQPSEGATIGTGSSAATILNDDVEPPVLAVAAVTASMPEGDGGAAAFTFAVTRTGGVRRPASVRWGVSLGDTDAADFADGVLPSGTVTFEAEETRKTVTVRIAGDTVVEEDEVFGVALSSPSAGATVGMGSASATIVNDDVEPPVLSVAAIDAVKAEGQEGVTAFTFRVGRSGDDRAAVGVSWQVAGADGSDFAGRALPSGTLTLAPGQAGATLTVRVQGDRQLEQDESFTVALAAPTGRARIGAGSARGTILNDDAEPATLSIAALDAVKPEGEHGLVAFTFKITRSGDASKAVNAAWRVTGVGADAADLDRGVLPSGTFWLDRGELSRVLTVRVRSDRRVEPDEAFMVTLGPSTTGARIGTATATGTIVNDDAPSPVLSVAAAVDATAEGSTGVTPLTFLVTRTGNAQVPVSARWQVVAGDTAADDFAGGRFPSGVVRLAPGAASATLIVPIQGDLQVERDEAFSIALSAPSGGVTIATGSAAATIVNDDVAATPSVLGVTALDAVKAEGQKGSTRFTFAVTRSGSLSQRTRVDWRTLASGASRAGADDFAGGRMPSGSVVFDAGEARKLITVQVVGDARRERSESFAVTLVGAASGTVLRPATAAGSILNDDR